MKNHWLQKHKNKEDKEDKVRQRIKTTMIFKKIFKDRKK